MLLCLAACTRQAPQIPSQRKGSAPVVDSTQLALLEMNQQLAQAADQHLAAFVLTLPESYALYEANVWGTVLEIGDTSSNAPERGQTWTLHMAVYTLDGRLLTDSEGAYCIGKNELPQAVDANIGEWYRGSRVRLYAPWYAAYGMRGTDIIPPYENIRIDLEIK